MQTAPPNRHPNAPSALPGARTSCALLTLFTVLLAWPWGDEAWAVIVRPCYFLLLFWFFWRTGRANPQLDGQAMRLVRTGFLVLWLSFTGVAVVHFGDLEPTHAAFVYLRQACESGAMFLLGTTLISYGLMLWIPQVLHSHQVLGSHYLRQRDELQVAANERSLLEQRLVDADRRGILGELAASIAHDLRNPLTIVKGTAESLCRKQRTPADIAEHTAVIRRNVDKADRTIASLIDLGRPRSNEPVELSVSELLRELHGLVHVEARRRKVQVEILPSRGIDLVRADRVLLAQAVLNLVLNACQASAPHHLVQLRAVRKRIGGIEHVACIIADRGSGLPTDWRTRLFTPFFTTKPEGTGLGLSSCRRIATEIGARLRVYPRHRGGARAVLLLPAADAMVRKPHTDEETPAWLHPTC